MCWWCKLARLSGGAFKKWQKEMKEKKVEMLEIKRMCNMCGKGLYSSQTSHKCSATDIEIVENMLKAIPERVKGKLTHSLLKEIEKKQERGTNIFPLLRVENYSL